MKEYKVFGYVIPKDMENPSWQPIGEGVSVKLPDDINPYESIAENFKLIASYWLILIEEIKKKKE